MTTQKNLPLPAAGVDLLSEETALIAGAVRSAINVDISRGGHFSRRAGCTRRVAVPGLHSLFYSVQRGWTFVGRDALLNRMDTTTYEMTPMYNLGSAHLIDYTEYNGNVYFTNRTAIGWVPLGSTAARQVGVPKPPAPELVAVSQGPLLPGKYAVAITLLDDRGEEGPASDVGIVNLPEGGGIRLQGLPQNIGWSVGVYITSADGDVLRQAALVPAVFPTYLVATDAEGQILDTQHLVQLPPGNFIRWHNGRLLVARGAELLLSEPMRPHLHNPAHGVIPFTGVVAFVESVADGLFVGDANGVWFLSGTDPSRFEQRLVSRCRAVPRSSLMMAPEHLPQDRVQTDQPVAVWLSTSGYVVGMPGGRTVELQPERVKVPPGLVGRSAYLFRSGRKQIVTPVNSSRTAANWVALNSVIS